MYHGSRSSGSSDPTWLLVNDEQQEHQEPVTAAQQRWTRLVRKALRIRRLQRIWGYLGGYLRGLPASLRERLTLLWPNGRP